MATEQGVLQALWGEVKPAVEARGEEAVRGCVALVRRHKTAEALAQFAEALSLPPADERAAMAALARRTVGASPQEPLSPPALRRWLWKAAVTADARRWATCRLLLDDPLPDRIWLFRERGWKFYRWTGTRFLGTPLAAVLEEVAAGRHTAAETLLSLSVGGETLANPIIL